MKKEFGKWLLDVSKYLITGVVITSLVHDFSGFNWWIIPVCGFILSLIILCIGLKLLKERSDS
jgi:divalent metal cation (Fe/Co/Zn/Cd) transporter